MHHLYAEECVIKIAKPGRLRRSQGLTHPDAPLLHLVENVLVRIEGRRDDDSDDWVPTARSASYSFNQKGPGVTVLNCF